VRELHRAGHTIRLLVRDKNAPGVERIASQNGAEICEGDVLDVPSLRGSMPGADAVIHLVGIISEIGDQTYERVHTCGTENMVAAAQRAGVNRFVHMSAMGTRPNAVARYHKSKWAAEEIVRHSGLDWTIFRPSMIYGPGDGFVNLFARMARFSPIVPVMGSGESKFKPVAVENVARSFVRSLSEPRSIGQTHDLCGNEVLTLAQIVDQILAVTERRRRKMRIPLSIARVQAAFLEFVYPKLLGKAPPLNRDQLLMLQEDNVGDARTADELFGLRHETFILGIARYLKRAA